jgi:hypothetical protein
LVFCLPLIVVYEVGTWAYHVDPAARVETRIIAFTWVRQLFDAIGASGHLIAPLATAALLLGWHVFAHQPWRLRLSTPPAMAAESVLLALPLLAAAGLMAMAGEVIPLRLTDAAIDRPIETARAALRVAEPHLADAVLAVGAGVYEELLFRLIGFALLHTLLVSLLRVGPRRAFVATLAVTSLAFAAYHHVPASGEPLEWGAFIFRTSAGVWLGMIFVTRGFGLAVGCHVAYDGLLVILPLLVAADASPTM